MDIFETLESDVRSYCRSIPATFTRAENYRLWDDEGREYIDFLAGAGALNYGHNDPAMRDRLVEYLKSNGVVHSLDMKTEAKAAFLERFRKTILEPRGLDYKVMFPGPTGTNAVEAALKLARKVTGRHTVVGFTNAFHGMTLGALAVTGNGFKRAGAGQPLGGAVAMPFCGYMGDGVDTIDYIERLLDDPGSGLDTPAAFIVETVQGEGGLNTADLDWLKRLEALCRKHDALLIVDDIQAGCGRTGTFFSFEPAGIEPDMVTLSKSIGGMGLPMALTLFRRDLDQWAPGEHNGTFRGHNLAFVAAHEALRFWEDDTFAKAIEDKAGIVREALERIAAEHPEAEPEVRGRGLFQGIAWTPPELAGEICAEAFERGLIVETSGGHDEVAKVMPPLTIDEAGLRKGLEILAEAVEAACVKRFGDSGRRDAA